MASPLSSTASTLEALFTKYLSKLQRTSTRFVRDFIHQIDWEGNRLIGIKGPRGAGKTTLVLQYLKQTALLTGRSLYFSLDDLYFSAHRLYYLGEALVRTGGRLLVLDEVHRYANWSQEIKNLYDDFPDLRIVFTGSSIKHLERSKGGLSFREFLQIQQIAS